MKQAILKFCESADNGLFLLDMPTGFGKTYSVLDFIVDNYDKPMFRNKKIFFLTTLKKNLPEEELYQHFVKKGKEKDYKKYCLRIEANADMVIRKLEELYQKKKIPGWMTKTKEFYSLLESVKAINHYENMRKQNGENYAVLSKFQKDLEEKIRVKEEINFRNLIIRELRQFKTVKEKRKQIAHNKEYQWIGELYQTVFTNEKRIFILSMDKFFLGNSTIVEPHYLFSENKIIKDSIIFIDEFDSTKERLLNRMILKGLENKIDYLGLFQRVYDSLSMRNFPTELTTISREEKKRLEENENYKRPDEILESFEKKFTEVYSNFSMQYSFKTEEDENFRNNRNFIFHDSQYHTIFKEEDFYIDLETDKKVRQNRFRLTKNKSKKENSVFYLLTCVKRCLSYFKNGIRFLSLNYKELKNEKKSRLDDDYTFENAVESVLTEFQLSPEQKKYLKPLVMEERKEELEKKGEGILKSYEVFFYDRGFRYYDFIDDSNHSMRSELRLFDFRDTPECYLLRLARKAKVIGVSATATLDTVIGNYDLDYLRYKLQNKYYTLPKEDELRLQTEFDDYLKNYFNTEIHVEEVSFEEEEKELNEIFDYLEEMVKEYKNRIFADYDPYQKENVIRVFKVLKAFILNASVNSFLCITNNLPKEKKGPLNLSLLRDFAGHIIQIYNIKGLNAERLLFGLTGDNFERKREEMIERLSNGEKLFVISSYHTIGSGQNLQYFEMIRNELGKQRKEKDFECIYLEKPTHLIVNINGDIELNEEGLLLFIFQMEFMMARGELSHEEGVLHIKRAFNKYTGNHYNKRRSEDPYRTESLNNAVMRTLIQAVGRICRTRNKNRAIFIYVDHSIFQKYDFTAVEGRRLNLEFEQIVKFSLRYKNKEINLNLRLIRLENLAVNKSFLSKDMIENMMREWTEENRKDWIMLREFCLKYPTINKIVLESFSINPNIYIEAPDKRKSYYYEQEGDFRKITVKFNERLSMEMSELEVSLAIIIGIPGVKEVFEEKGYATEFVENELLLNPFIFNNIYKGALGETVGKIILEQFGITKIKELPADIFEKFDYTLGNGIFIDFKFWKDTNAISAREEKNKILNKLEKCGGRKAIIVNLLHDKEMKSISGSDGRILEIPYLYRTDKKEIAFEKIEEIRRFSR